MEMLLVLIRNLYNQATCKGKFLKHHKSLHMGQCEECEYQANQKSSLDNFLVQVTAVPHLVCNMDSVYMRALFNWKYNSNVSQGLFHTFGEHAVTRSHPAQL